MRLKHRRHGLLELQKQRRSVAGLEQHDQATGADTADANDFLRDVDHGESINEQAPVEGKRGPVPLKKGLHLAGLTGIKFLIDAHNQRRIRDDDATPIDNSRQLFEGHQTVLANGLAEYFLLPILELFAVTLNALQGRLRFKAVVVQVEWADFGSFSDEFPIIAHGVASGGTGLLPGEAFVAA